MNARKIVASLALALAASAVAFAQAQVYPRPELPPAAGGAGQWEVFEVPSDEAREVRDGDTLAVHGREVRLLGVDTPEVWRRRGEQWVHDPEPFGPEAATFLEGQLQDRQLVIFCHRCTEGCRDAYGRSFAYVFAEVAAGWALVNAEVAAGGWGWVYAKTPSNAAGPHDAVRGELVRLQQGAIDARRNVWGAFGNVQVAVSRSGIIHRAGSCRASGRMDLIAAFRQGYRPHSHGEGACWSLSDYSQTLPARNNGASPRHVGSGGRR